MAINLQESPTKDLLQRSNIRTMKKDLAMLRETDLLQEKQKISKIKITEEKPSKTELETEKWPSQQASQAQSIPKPAGFSLTKKESESLVDSMEQNIQPPANLPTETGDSSLNQWQDKLGKIVKSQSRQDAFKTDPQSAKQEDDMQSKVKDYATETEKQQIFLLKAQKAHLENQMKESIAKTESSERNRLLSEKKGWQEKLDNILQEGGKNEQEQEMIKKKEEESDVPTEQQKFKEEKLSKEEQGDNIEKKRWSAESELAKLENKIKNLNEGQKQLEASRNNIEKELTDINASLKVIYGNILKREEAKKGQQAQAKRQTEAPDMPENEISSSNAPEKNILKEPEYLKGISPAAKEKLARSTKIEEKQRLKFMEDVERWVALAKAREQENN